MTTHKEVSHRNPYWSLWRSTPKEALYLMLGFPIALTGFSLAVPLVVLGVGTLITFLIGIFVMILALYVGRGFGLVHVNLLEWTGRKRLERPDWQDDQAATGFGGWLSAVLGNGHYWLYLLHTALLGFVLTIVTWTIAFVWIAVGLTGISAWFIRGQIGASNFEWSLGSWFFGLFGVDAAAPNLELADNFVAFAIGFFFIATLPVITRGLVLAQWWLARGTLTSFRSDGLRREVESLEASRGAALSAEGHSLRRLERDIHDGPQQRLVRLRMDLAAAERQLDTNPELARTLIAEAQVQSSEALEELRALSRGFAPPLLMDRGLVAALQSVSSRATVPTTVHSELPEGVVLPNEIERAAYFVVAELVTNVAKHSQATAAEIHVTLTSELERTILVVQVADNGGGGADVTIDHGLAGIDERVRGVAGRLEIDSPQGGPTTVSAFLPLPRVDGARSNRAL